MRRLDGGKVIAFVNLASGAAACPIDRRAALARFHASEDGTILSGAAAFAAMWRAIPILRPFGLAARNSVVLRLLEATYLQFLKIRPHLQTWMRRRERVTASRKPGR